MSEGQATIDEARNNFLEAKKRLVHAFDTTPDERVDWTPSPSARTPAQIVGHAAGAIKNLKETMDGNTFGANSPAEAEVWFRKEEENISGRTQPMQMLEASSQEYLAYLDALTPDKLETMIKMPFGFGLLPLRVVLTFPYLHTASHVPQLEYIQTIYGDRDWHIG